MKTFIIALLFSVQLFATSPQLPATFSTRYSQPVNGTVKHVVQGANLQAAFDAANMGDVLVLDAGAVFPGNFRLPIKNGSGWIYVISSELEFLSEGKRITPDDSVHMAKLVNAPSGGNYFGLLYSFKSAHHWRFAGIEFSTPTNVYNLIQTGYGSALYSDAFWKWTAVRSEADLPHDLIFDRCYIHSTDFSPKPAFARTGLMLNGNYMALVDSRIENFKEYGGGEGHGIEIWQGVGPYKIVNNYIEASGENFLVGGSDPLIQDNVPSDIEFRGNHVYKRPEWVVNGVNLYTIKNHFELKNAQRVLCEGNLMEWVPFSSVGQSATSIVLTVRDQNGTAPWSMVRDVTIRDNRISHCAVGLRVTGSDDLHASQQTQRILVENNAWDDINRIYYSGTSGFNASSTAAAPLLDFTFIHNLILHTGTGAMLEFLSAPVGSKAVNGFVVRDNIFTHGDYGVFGNAVGTGTVALNTYTSNYLWTKNVVIDRVGDRDYAYWKTNFATKYPAGNALADGVAAVGFVDYANGNYQLSGSSPYRLSASDGKDPGPDWEELNPAILKAHEGTASSIGECTCP